MHANYKFQMHTTKASVSQSYGYDCGILLPFIWKCKGKQACVLVRKHIAYITYAVRMNKNRKSIVCC